MIAAARIRLATALAVALSFSGVAPALACNDVTPCLVERDGVTLGEYLIVAPPADAAQPTPAVVFLHGWRATAQAMMKQKGLVEAARSAEAALVLPQGEGMTWSYPGSPAQFRDEFRFFEALREDLTTRHGVDPSRILISGFSMGASMAWNIACRQGSGYWGAATFAGAFWDPIPETCPDPVAVLLHTHGTSDGVVPIEGRPIGESFRQSDARESMTVFADGLEPMADREDARGFDCEEWRGVAVAGRSRIYEFCTHDGGHIYRGAWIARAIERLRAIEAASASTTPQGG